MSPRRRVNALLSFLSSFQLSNYCSSHPVSPLIFNEQVPSTVIRALTPPLQNYSFSGTTSHDLYKDQESESVTDILVREQAEVRAQDESGINMLPDDVLLEIFALCRKDNFIWFFEWGPNGLVHVCRRWRQLVFGSPRRLDLQLYCTHGSPVKKDLGCWPPIPISVSYSYEKGFTPDDAENLIFALKQTDRVYEVSLDLTRRELREVTAVMQRPFPVLTRLAITWEEGGPPVLPIGFLGGSAPCLQHLLLEGIPFPKLLMVLSSTSNLVDLQLDQIPEEGVISMEAMVACLARSPRLQSLIIGFQLALFRPYKISRLPVARSLLPALTRFEFRGPSKYLPEISSRIDGPRLNQIHLRYFFSLIDFQVAQLFQFLDRSEDPKLALIRRAEVTFLRRWVTFNMHPHSDGISACVNSVFDSKELERQILHLAQVFGQPSAIVSGVVHLKLGVNHPDADCHDNAWLRLFRQCSAIRALCVYGKFAGHIALILDGVASEMVADVLPALGLIYIVGQPVSCVEKFLAARRLSAHPVTIVESEAEFHERLNSYIHE